MSSGGGALFAMIIVTLALAISVSLFFILRSFFRSTFRRLDKVYRSDSAKRFTEKFEEAYPKLGAYGRVGNGRGYARSYYVLCTIAALYLLIFLVPDSVWLNIGLTLPNKTNIPDFILTKMGHTSFPVSVFVFFVTAPFFFTIMLSYFLIVIMSSGYKGFLLLRELQIEIGNWKYALILAVFFGLVFPCMAWEYSGDFLNPSRGGNYTASLFFKNKLFFFFFYGGLVVAIIPGSITLLCAEIRFRFTTLINKEI